MTRRDARAPRRRAALRARGDQFKCPAEAGKFAVDNEMPMENAVDYELGGAKGTFRFDPDHTLDDVPRARSSRASCEKGVEHIVLGWDHVCSS